MYLSESISRAGGLIKFWDPELLPLRKYEKIKSANNKKWNEIKWRKVKTLKKWKMKNEQWGNSGHKKENIAIQYMLLYSPRRPSLLFDPRSVGGSVRQSVTSTSTSTSASASASSVLLQLRIVYYNMIKYRRNSYKGCHYHAIIFVQQDYCVDLFSSTSLLVRALEWLHGNWIYQHHVITAKLQVLLTRCTTQQTTSKSSSQKQIEMLCHMIKLDK